MDILASQNNVHLNILEASITGDADKISKSLHSLHKLQDNLLDLDDDVYNPITNYHDNFAHNVNILVTSCQMAAKKGYIPIVDLLLEKVEVYACIDMIFVAAACSGQTAMLEHLFQHDLQEETKDTAFICAIVKDSISCAKLLLPRSITLIEKAAKYCKSDQSQEFINSMLEVL